MSIKPYSMLESIITSKSRIKLLLKFFLNPENRSYLRELSSEFGDSTNSVRVELNRLVDAKLLKTEKNGRNIYYSANIDHPLYPDIHNILKKMTGLDHVYSVISKLGNIDNAFITGDYAKGVDSGVIDLVLVGNFEQAKIFDVIRKAEDMVKRKIRTLMLSPDEYTGINVSLKKQKRLYLWGKEGLNG